MKERIAQLREEFDQAVGLANSVDALEQVRISFLSRRGSIAQLVDEFKGLSVDEKRVLGPVLQDFKAYAQRSYEQKQKLLKKAQASQGQALDVTAYRPQEFEGGLHVYTRIIDDLIRIFVSMGYDIADGKEVETDFYNFEALNIPPDHPARDMQDTFWLKQPGILLRTHTSSVQIHAMQQQGAPLALFSPGRVYRHEQVDASHDSLFTQAEGVLIDKDVSMSNLLATVRTFLKAIFEKDDLKIRVRPGYFPFVEPGIEVDGSCPFCSSGCSVCKKTGWIELVGAGLVHPNVLKAGNIDSKIYSGFAFGFGIERLAMIKYGIDDIRLFHSSKLNFLRQFA